MKSGKIEKEDIISDNKLEIETDEEDVSQTNYITSNHKHKM